MLPPIRRWRTIRFQDGSGALVRLNFRVKWSARPDSHRVRADSQPAASTTLAWLTFWKIGETSGIRTRHDSGHSAECWLLHHGLRLKLALPHGLPLLRLRRMRSALCKKALSRHAFAPRSSASARRAYLTLRKLNSAGGASTDAQLSPASKWPLDPASHRDFPFFGRAHRLTLPSSEI